MPSEITRASSQPVVADVFATLRTQGVYPDDRGGHLPHLEFPAENETNTEAP